MRVPPKRTSNSFDASPFPPQAVTDLKASAFALRQLVTAADLSVVFQPILHTQSLDVFAYEALVRCSVADLRNPAHLFERACKDRCAGRLGRAIRDIAIPLCEGVPIFLNVHPMELEERWLVRPDDPMYAHDRTVFVEITEAVPLQRFDLCRSVLDEARARGDVRLVIDDLGAGYSNLKYIVDLEPAVVKVDRSIIAGTRPGSRAEKLLCGIVELCHSLNAKVVVEGIETEEEASVARRAHADLVQGYLYAKPGFPLPLRNRVR
jgi:EAL domain-containing protein (putative c-di-GMP-specific phosphodiesterase class I)